MSSFLRKRPEMGVAVGKEGEECREGVPQVQERSEPVPPQAAKYLVEEESSPLESPTLSPGPAPQPLQAPGLWTAETSGQGQAPGLWTAESSGQSSGQSQSRSASSSHQQMSPVVEPPIWNSQRSSASGAESSEAEDQVGPIGSGAENDVLSPLPPGGAGTLEITPHSPGSERHKDFLQRKAARKVSKAKKKASSVMDTHGFLSHLPEVNADIAYRFCFEVIGIAAQKSVEAACNSEIQEDNALPASPSHKKKEEAYRCFSHVPYPMGSEAEFTTPGRLDPMKFCSDVPKLCKLIFDPRQSATQIVGRKTRMEALSSAIVCTLVIDPGPGEPSFHEQLLAYERVVDQIHFTRKALRPARAILLCRRGEDDGFLSPPGHLSWEARLEEYEMCCDENVWKLGPVLMKQPQEIHSAFATIASKRILRGHESQGEDSDGSQQSDPPPCYDAEMDWENVPEFEEDEQPIWMTHLHEITESENEDDDDGDVFQPLNEAHHAPLGPSRFSGNRQQWLSAMQRGAA